jgi:Domain of unknown function DUF29
MLEQPLKTQWSHSLYEQDFHQWTQQMATVLRNGHFDQLDIENIAEEIESLGRSDKRELKRRLTVLLMHLLKWHYQPEQRSNSWRATITEQRIRILDLLSESPSLIHYLKGEVDRCYTNAKTLAADETGLAPTIFPQDCPYLLTEVLEQKPLTD